MTSLVITSRDQFLKNSIIDRDQWPVLHGWPWLVMIMTRGIGHDQSYHKSRKTLIWDNKNETLTKKSIAFEALIAHAFVRAYLVYAFRILLTLVQ